jgi:hypothetical protein
MVPTLVHTLFEPPAAAQVGARVWRSSPNSSQMPPASRRPGRGHPGLRPLPEEHWARPGRTARRSVSTPRFAGPPTWSVSSRQRAAVVRLVGPLGAEQTTSGRSWSLPGGGVDGGRQRHSIDRATLPTVRSRSGAPTPRVTLRPPRRGGDLSLLLRAGFPRPGRPRPSYRRRRCRRRARRHRDRA